MVGEFTNTGCESGQLIGLRRVLEGEGRGGRTHTPPEPGLVGQGGMGATQLGWSGRGLAGGAEAGDQSGVV